ncbi:MAG: hypothetical protein NW206_05210 [Hyphomonadaceae bacterium]|nr:hypothetical protein [Hyphomonadaceae bacterium]
MLRTALFVLAFGAPTLAAAEQFPDSALRLEVRSDVGTVMSRIESVERNGDGRIVSVEAPGLAPADAPADAELVADNDAGERFFVSAPGRHPSAQRNDRQVLASASQVRVR